MPSAPSHAHAWYSPLRSIGRVNGRVTERYRSSDMQPNQLSEPNMPNCTAKASSGEHARSPVASAEPRAAASCRALSSTNCAESTPSHASRQPSIDDGKRPSAAVPPKQASTNAQASTDAPPHTT